MKEGGNIWLSLLISCTGWDTQQLMAFATISYQSLPLRPHLDLSRTPPAFFAQPSSRNTHAILTHRSDDEAFLPRPSSPPSSLCCALSPPSSIQLCFPSLMNHEPPPTPPSISIHPEKTQIDGAKLRATDTCVNSLFCLSPR